ncbi:hypothetical protein HID58_061217 [Brassica napus]|uniref:Uncharacterized protein n=1 Tax=Brassica napus TaxID=3708 RepID=A0ABQ7ZXY2_BRANA|nr:hypothetical protein HID58_061217 [Brassica napus]
MKSGEAAVDKEDKIVVPPRKEPEFGKEKESKERKEKALKEIEMGNAACKATVLSDLLGTISSYQSKATFVAYKQCSGNKMDKVNEIKFGLHRCFFYHEMLHVVVILDFGFSFDVSKTRCSNSTLGKFMKINNNQSFIDFKCYDVLFT